MSETEKLINFVRKRRLLYDLSDSDYKNREKKAEAWLEIAMEMGVEDVKHWIVKWKSLRDNYNKFKKNNESASSQYKKYKNWPWADQMRFLDEYNVRRVTESNACDQVQEFQDTNEIDSQPITQNLNSTVDASHVTARDIAKRKMRNSAGPSDKVRVKEKNEQKSKFDGVDYFFLSYAQTFKKFPSRMQTMLKLEIATLFARYEFQTEGDSDDNLPRMPPQTLQRGYDSCSSTSNS